MGTVTYGMPPDGYETVTLPESLVQRLDELDGDSHTATIRMLLAERKQSNESEVPDDLREQLDRIEASASTAEERAGRVESTLEDLEGRMR